MTPLEFIIGLGPGGFVGLMSFVGVTALILFGLFTLELRGYEKYKTLDRWFKSKGFLGILSAALFYLAGCSALWSVIYHITRFFSHA